MESVSTMAVSLRRAVEPEVVGRVWVISDLQTANRAEAERCLSIALEDLGELTDTFDQLWYLGDAVSGTEIEPNRDVAEIQIDMLGTLGIPCRYVMGNHDLDPPRLGHSTDMPFYDLVSDHSDWRTTANRDDFYFIDSVGDHRVLFLSDHLDPDLEWTVTHGKVHGDDTAYPHERADYQAALEEVASEGKPIILAGHNAFPGGNRPAQLQARFHPLPAQTRLHLYGHAHIGDERRMPSTSGKNAYRTISFIDHSQVPQVDVASLEDRRGDLIRSAVLELHADGGCAVHIRNHTHGEWMYSCDVHRPQRSYVTEFVGTDQKVASRTQRDQLLEVISWLDEEYQLLSHIDLPYESEITELVINADPTRSDGSAMRQPMELPNGWYVDGGIDKLATRREIEGFVERCGLAVDFGGIWVRAG